MRDLAQDMIRLRAASERPFLTDIPASQNIR
jgi:hypothetical protein